MVLPLQGPFLDEVEVDLLSNLRTVSGEVHLQYDINLNSLRNLRPRKRSHHNAGVVCPNRF